MNELSIQFEILAPKHFSFLETTFRFVRNRISETLLKYESKYVYVLIGYDSERSYEISIDLAAKNSGDNPPFNFGEVLRSKNAPQDIPSSYQVTTTTVLNQCLENLAQALWKYSADLLRNDPGAFTRLANLRRKESAELDLNLRLRRARSIVEVAWEKRNYQAIVEALQPLQLHLSLAERKKLKYSQKQLIH